MQQGPKQPQGVHPLRLTKRLSSGSRLSSLRPPISDSRSTPSGRNFGGRSHGDLRTGLHIQELRDSLAGAHALLENIVQAQELAKGSQAHSIRELESFKTWTRTFEERPTDSRSTPGHGTFDHKVLLTRQKGFPNLKPFNGEGGSARWKEWRFGIITWIEQEYPAVASLIRRVENLETESPSPRTM